MGKRLILKASAGTGKTYRLSLEYIASLVQGIDFKDILVMTFTKKATAEIKERILKFLKEIVEDEKARIEIEKNIQNIYGKDFNFDINKIKKIYKNIVENKDKLKIYTIDSFTNTIFKKAIAPYLKIYSYEIIDKTENRKILIKTFEKLFENREDFNIFKSFLENNSEKNMDIYVDLIENIIEQRWKMILIGDKIDSKIEFEYETPLKFLTKMEDILSEVSVIKGKPFLELIKKDFQSYFTSSSKEEYLYENYSSFIENEIWNKNKVRPKKGDVDSHIEDLNYLYENFRENLSKELYNKLIIPYEEKLLKTIEKIYSIYDEIKFREKRFTHTDISNYTFKYLEDRELGFIDENGMTEEFFEVIDGKLKSIFIDEFQDTSILQWRILKNILDKSENIICVGDEKQSIYGWRGGEKRLFENLSQIIDGVEEELEICFRSKENIVEYTNSIFKDISTLSGKTFPLNYDWKFNSVKFRDNEQKGFIKLLTEEEEVSSIEKMIAEIEENFSSNYNGIGILARTKKTLESIASALGEKGIPYTLESDTSIVESRGIGGIYSLISWLVKKDFLSLLDFLRSDLINLSTSQLKNIIKNREKIENFLYDNSVEIDIKLEDIELNIFNTLKELYNNYLTHNGETEFLTYEMLLKTGIGSRFQNEEDTVNIFNFYKLLKDYRYFNDFLIDYEENSQNSKFKKISTGNSNSISLMTIHKSKGLEFDTLFYFIPAKSGNKKDIGMEFYLEMDKSYSTVNSFLITDNKFNNILKNINDITFIQERDIKREHEEINNLYVALTRPKNNIYVVIEDIKKIENSIFSTLLKNRDNGELISNISEEVIAENGKEYNITLHSPKIVHKEEKNENQKKGMEKIYSHTLQLEWKRVRGLIVHYFLENILTWTEKEIEFSKKLTSAKYSSIMGEDEIDELFSKENIEYIYKQCRNIFSTSWDFVYREYPIYLKTDSETKDFRIDRLMIKLPNEKEKGIIYIADYKTGSYNEEQLNNYKLAVVERIKRNGQDIENFEIKTEYIELNL